MAYRSLVRQTLHYFSRPHQAQPGAVVDSPAAWRGEALREEDWLQTLPDSSIAQLDRALAHAHATGKPMQRLTRDDFPLGELGAQLAHWRRTLAQGRGFLVLRGIPVARWSTAQAETFFWCLGLHLGIPGAQNPQGDLLGHVRAEAAVAQSRQVRAYRTRVDIAYHCDLADVVGLLCLKRAAAGGRSRIASSVSVFNEMMQRAPELAAQLFEPMYFDTKSEGGLRYFPVRPCRYAFGQLRTFYHPDYFREAPRHAGVPAHTSLQRRMLDLYDDIAREPGMSLSMDLLPGDVQLLSNHTIVHGRTAFEDGDDGQGRRHLLRLWLSLPLSRSLRFRALAWQSRIELLGALLWQRLAQR